MAGGVMHTHLVVAEGDRLLAIEPVDRWRLLHAEAKHPPLLDGATVERKVVPVKIDRCRHHFLGPRHARHMVDVRVRQKDMHNPQIVVPHGREQVFNLVTRVNDDGLTGLVATNDEPILVKRRNVTNFENHSTVPCNLQCIMILCVVDDLMFSIKISTAAKALGADTFFVRSADEVVPRIREKMPTLVILDLNSTALRPLAVIEELKADPALKHIPTLGYVSHVQTELIAAARGAGIDDVLARSAFSAQLGDILTVPRTTKPTRQGPAE